MGFPVPSSKAQVTHAENPRVNLLPGWAMGEESGLCAWCQLAGLGKGGLSKSLASGCTVENKEV